MVSKGLGARGELQSRSNFLRKSDPLYLNTKVPSLNLKQNQICSLYGDFFKKVRPAYYVKEVGIRSKTKLRTVVALEEVTGRRHGGASFVLFLDLNASDVSYTRRTWRLNLN